MADNNRLEYIISAVDRSKAALDEVRKNLQEAHKSAQQAAAETQKANQKSAGSAQQAAQAVQQAAKSAVAADASRAAAAKSAAAETQKAAAETQKAAQAEAAATQKAAASARAAAQSQSEAAAVVTRANTQVREHVQATSEAIRAASTQSRAAQQEVASSAQSAAERSRQAAGVVQQANRATSQSLREVSRQARESGAGFAALRSSLGGLALGAFGKSAIEAALNVDSIKTSLKGVTGSAAEAERQFQALKAISRERGFNFQVLAQGVLQLQAAGFAAKDAQRAVVAFANATRLSGGTTDDLKAVLYNLTQIKAMGKLTGDELRESLSRLPILARIIQQEFGTLDKDSIRKLGLTGEQVVGIFIDGASKLEQSNGAARLSFDQLGDAAKEAVTEIGNAILPLATTLNETLIPALRTATELFKDLPKPAQQGLILGGLGAVAAPRVLSAGRTLSGLRGAAPVAETVATTAVGGGLGVMEAAGATVGATALGEYVRRQVLQRSTFGSAPIMSPSEAAKLGMGKATRERLATEIFSGPTDDALKAGVKPAAKKGLFGRIGAGLSRNRWVAGAAPWLLNPYTAIAAGGVFAADQLNDIRDNRAGRQRVGMLDTLNEFNPFRDRDAEINEAGKQLREQMLAEFAKSGTPRQRLMAQAGGGINPVVEAARKKALEGTEDDRLQAELERAQALAGDSAQQEAQTAVPVLQQIKTRLIAQAKELLPKLNKDAESTKKYWELIRDSWQVEGQIISLTQSAQKEIEQERKKAEADRKRQAQEQERQRKQALDDAKAARAAQAEMADAQIENLPEGRQADERVKRIIPILRQQQQQMLAELKTIRPGTEEYYKKGAEIWKAEKEIGEIQNNALKARETARKKAEQEQREALRKAQEAAREELRGYDAQADLASEQIDTLAAINPELAAEAKQKVLLPSLLSKLQGLRNAVPGESPEDALRRQLEAERTKQAALSAAGFDRESMRFGRTLGGGRIPLFDQGGAMELLGQLGQVATGGRNGISIGNLTVTLSGRNEAERRAEWMRLYSEIIAPNVGGLPGL